MNLKPYKVNRVIYNLVKDWFDEGYTASEIYSGYYETMQSDLSLTTLRKIKLSKNYKAYCNMDKQTYNKPRVKINGSPIKSDEKYTVYRIENSIFKPKEGLLKRLKNLLK